MRHMPFSERDLTKLPKWAQQEIERLQHDLEWAKGKLTAGPEDSDTFANPYSDATPLGKGTIIAFHTDEKGSYFNVRMRENGELDIHYSPRGGAQAIGVVPSASNSVRLRPVGW